MENTQISTTKIAIRYGLIVGLASVIFTAILYFAKLETVSGLNLVPYLILIIGMYFAMQDFKRQNESYMSYGQGIGIGVAMAAISGILLSIFSTIYIFYVDPTIIEKVKNMQMQALEKEGISDAQIAQTMEMMDKMMTPGISFIISLISVIFIGLIISLIMSAFLKKNQEI